MHFHEACAIPVKGWLCQSRALAKDPYLKPRIPHCVRNDTSHSTIPKPYDTDSGRTLVDGHSGAAAEEFLLLSRLRHGILRFAHDDIHQAHTRKTYDIPLPFNYGHGGGLENALRCYPATDLEFAVMGRRA